MSKTITFNWSQNAECIIEPGEYEIRLSYDQIQVFSFLAKHGKSIITAYRKNLQYHQYCPCCGPDMLKKAESEIEDLMYNMEMFFDLHTA